MAKTYITQYNGGKPYQVEVSKSKIIISDTPDSEDSDNEHSKKEQQIMTIENYARVFVDEGNDFEGATVLINVEDLKYMFVFNHVYSFEAEKPIDKFYVNMGNSNVPYSYAVDEANNYYLLTEGVIFTTNKEFRDPYNFFYEGKFFSTNVRSPEKKEAWKEKYNLRPMNMSDRLLCHRDWCDTTDMKTQVKKMFQKHKEKLEKHLSKSKRKSKPSPKSTSSKKQKKSSLRKTLRLRHDFEKFLK